MNLGISRFDRILAENVAKSMRRAETERYKAELGAGARVTAAKMYRPPTEWRAGAEAGAMERARLTAGVRREEIAGRATEAAETARLKGAELGLAGEEFEFYKGYLKKKKKKKEAGISPVEEIESIVAAPRY